MALPDVMAEIVDKPNPQRRDRSCPRAVKRARHNSYPVKKPGQAASTRHPGPATIHFWHLQTPPPTNADTQTGTATQPAGHHTSIHKGTKQVSGGHTRPPAQRHQPSPTPTSPPQHTRRRDRAPDTPQTSSSTP
jgi:hypothetical protein